MHRRQLLATKANAVFASIMQMDQKERERNPTEEFGEDYNSLRTAVMAECSELEGLLPPKAVISESMGGKACFTPYREIATFCRQMHQLMMTADE